MTTSQAGIQFLASEADVVIGALCAWRENRSGQVPGMQSVLNVLVNRAAKEHTSIYQEAVRNKQFDSMTKKGDPQLGLFPSVDDPQWVSALSLSTRASAGILEDITGGATSYYALTMQTPPYWAASMTETVTIAGQKFFK